MAKTTKKRRHYARENLTEEQRERIKMLVDELQHSTAEQGKGALYSEGKFCCLGRACEIYRRETGQGEWRLQSGQDWFFHIPEGMLDEYGERVPACDYESGYDLPHIVVEWYGFNSSDPIVAGAGAHNSATGINDGLGWSFRRIGRAFYRYWIEGKNQ